MTRTRKDSKSSQASAARAERISELTGQLSAGIQDLSSTQAWQEYLDFQAKFPRYSFGNAMLILMQCPAATMVMPYGKPEKPGTWMNIGRHACKGERALLIRKPSFRKIAAEDSPDGKEHRALSFVWVPVFDISQTEGEPVPENVVHLLDGDDPDGILALVVTFIQANGFTVEFVPEIAGSGANGDCSYATRTVRVCTSGRTQLQQVKTAIHEAAHMLLHESSMLERGLKELEAESVAYVVAQYLGLQTSEYSFGYVLGWAGNGERAVKAIKESGGRIQSAVKSVLAGIGAIEVTEYDEPAAGSAAAPAGTEAVAA
jgi:hypothetical protein